MEIYLVGGAVRDQLLGLPIKEKDWVVVGATIEDMLHAGFRQVGKDFPVFLHPKTGEEYALARTERKVGQGYTGFKFDTSPTVTLKEDLKRRDLTINAIAQAPSGELIDPYHGQADLAKKILRHVSPAFEEDPVRILRVARFNARFDFDIAPDTLALMRKMVEKGEVDALVAERVWKELERALQESRPENFFAVLAACDALAVLLPQLAASSAGFTALKQAVVLSPHSPVRFAALLHTLSENEIKTLCERYRVPTDYRTIAILVSKYLPYYQDAKNLSADDMLNLLLATDAFRRPDRFKDFLTSCTACSSINATAWLLAGRDAAKKIEIKELTAYYSGQELAKKIKEKRWRAIQSWLKKS
ncbi:MAG: cca [Gammaproteobacteria bacterium]|jgi:tRNA nucleotidyltransferase (CCA-adding enzyme)|nr:cca [Gammaproteobacteria bacterium]